MGAPGMTIALEILAPADLAGAFGQDGIAPKSLSFRFIDPADSDRVMFGIPVVSWQGRMIQVPLFIRPSAGFDFDSAGFGFQVVRGTAVSNVGHFFIGRPQEPIQIVGSVAFGDGSLGRKLSKGNTMIVESIDVTGELGNRGIIEIDRRDPDALKPGNPRLLPVTILSAGPIRFTNIEIHIEGRGKNGGPGGGGGGSGNQGTGGEGYTGGGSSTATSDSNIGSASDPTIEFGGMSPTKVVGGRSDQGDQGGGGGTGHPFGTSGNSGQPNFNSSSGGYGGGSAGGEVPDLHYGGGGGAFGEKATRGGGVGDNAGNRNGGRLLIPLAGGSGGGAGNSLDEEIFPAGSGGGGGGSIALIAFDEMTFSNTTVIARGDSGTTGVDNTGSGGGGSGGSFVAASNTSLRAERLVIDVAGGVGGANTLNGLAGGNGSVGISRIDGLDTAITCTFPERTHQSSLSQKRLPQQTSTTIEVGGIAGQSEAFADSIRIYYRNYHSGWTRVDTVSFAMGGKRYWKKSIPALNDAELFVSAYQKVKDPRKDTNDLDPQWMSTHVSHQIVKALSRPQLAVIDTIRFPNTKVGRCIDSNVRIKNLGEAPLEVTGITIALPFRSSALPLSINGYDDSVITLSFCPDTTTCVDTLIILHTNAGDKAIRLIGCGVQTDERVGITPSPIIFKDTKVGECDTVTVTIRSIGADPTSIEFSSLFDPPFHVDTVGKKKLLANGKFETFTVTFCPTDSGVVRDTLIVEGPNALFIVQGKGIRRILEKRDMVTSSLCLNYPEIIEDTIRNRGNDVIRIDNVVASSPQLVLLSAPSASILPGAQHVYQYQLTPAGVGSSSATATYSFANDSVAALRIEFIANERKVSASIADFYSCADTTQDHQMTIINDGSRVVIVAIAGFGDNFAPLGPTQFDLSKGSHTLDIRFDPKVKVGEFTDTIDIVVTTEGCGDTTLNLVLHGFGTSEQLVFSKTSLDFGDVLSEDCVSDSIFITNVCGPAATIKPEQFPGSTYFTSSLTEERTLQTGEGIWVIYTFCPKSEGVDSVVHRIAILDPAQNIDIRLKGRGVLPPDQPKAYLHLTDALIAIGSEGVTSLFMDSVSGTAGLTSAVIILNYDPALVRLRRVQSINAASSTINIDSIEGKITIELAGQLSKELVRFTWLGLLGPSTSTLITIDSFSSAPASVYTAVPGKIDLVDCFGLAGQVLAGVLRIGVIKPQPVNESLKFFVEAKYDLRGAVHILDASGRSVLDVQTEFRMGLHEMELPIGGLPSGAYWVEIRAAGIVRNQRFWK
jgi:hypothetical protein